jgi:hemolysin III
MKRTRITDREIPRYTRGEEIFNMTSHIAGFAFALAALIFCVYTAAIHENTWGIVTSAVYGVTMIILYTMSSIYHGLIGKGTSKKVFQVFDHCSIFFMIAGTYTPILLCGLRPAHPLFAWVLFGIVWASAILGVVFNAIDLKKYRVLSMICYLCSGWLIVSAIQPLQEVLTVSGLVFLFGGGIAYTVGTILYGLGKKHKYMHSVFHLFVVAGTVLHFFCILYLL